MKYALLNMFYFLFFIGTGAFQFLNLYYVDVGLTTGEIGILFAAGPLVMIFAQPFWGMLTDYWDSPKITLFIMIIGSAGTALFYPFSYEFENLLILNIIYFFFQSSVPPIADATAMSLLDDRNDFGKVRLWGSVGYAAGVIAVGKVLDLFGLQLMFILHSCFLLIALTLALRLPIKKGGKKDFSMQKAVSLFKNPAFLMFLLFSFLVHLTVHANNSFYAIYIQNMGATLTVVGLALLIKSILEVPFFALSKKLMNNFSFPILLSATAIIYAVRWIILGYSSGLEILVWSQILLSLSYSIQYFVSVAYVDVIAPERYRATGQTFYWAVTFGLGGWLGNLLAGFVLDYIEIDEMYRLAALISLASVSLLWIKPKKRT
ncbi:hypothetical protein CIL03_11790 [Virgibacillus indicus]|uniref:Major facilitator superfamily (MFS) profile domain-containing protein n=1 Tax=Virgibacillus indicus TaxID=2024554 RepID=A0A265NAJ8_9BACI|nr:MFS transporter [Virgibacillus indicus]OZU88326.1 hypothetical protein CIL03_11790 [Virgibacillus indicus]